MATIDLGKIKLVNRGAYNNSTAYTVDDLVQSGGSTYICIQNSTGNAVTNASYWSVLAEGGDVASTLTTQGDILYRDGSGLAKLAAGTSGQFLKTQGSGANPTWANLASNVDIVNYTTFDGTGVNSMSVTTDWSSNNYWKLEVFGQHGMNAAQGYKMRLRNASGDITSQTYNHIGMYSHAQENHSGVGNAAHYDLNGGLDAITLNGWGFNSGRVHNTFKCEIYKPDANGRQNLHRHYYNVDPSSSPYHAYYIDSYHTTDTSTKTGFSIYGNSSANFINGFVITMGYKYQ